MSSSLSSSSRPDSTMLLLIVTLTFMASLMAASAGDFYKQVDITFGGTERVQILDGGQLLTLSLDNYSGSGFMSKREFLFARIDTRIKLVPGNSAGTVTTYYLSSDEGDNHDEIDFEFLGNLSGQPYIVHTNIYVQGKGNREQQFYLWFDPREAFHTYSIVWNAQRVIWMVDSIPIREFNNDEAIGIPFPNNQSMRVYSSLWNADDWATEGGRVKTNWTLAPFTASYKKFRIKGCEQPIGSSSSSSSCGDPKSTESLTANDQAWETEELDVDSLKRLRWVQKKFMVYNYCTDYKRFPLGLPPECRLKKSF